MDKRICIVGAGFSGAVLARAFSEAGHACLVVDERPHAAGNCHTERDAETGVMVHRYGPHIFHTDHEDVWSFITSYGEMAPYVNRVKTTVGGRVFSMPINLHTINQFFDKAMTPEEAQAYVKTLSVNPGGEPANFEEQGRFFVGDGIYEAFFHGYTKKQWGMEPSMLPASILKRLPLRFTYDDNYFFHKYQGMPREGYTAIVEKVLDAPKVEVRLGARFEDLDEDFAHVFYSGPIDRYFNHELGRLGYRTLDFEPIRGTGDILGCAVMNFGDEATPWTRISEHKYFSPWEMDQVKGSIAFREYSRLCGPDDIPYYPIRLTDEKSMLGAYVEKAKQETGVTFLGRLGTYAYLDMDVTIKRAMETAEHALARFAAGETPDSFVHEP